MGDFAAHDLWRQYPEHKLAACAGCRGLVKPDERCYADAGHIWHSRCWPDTDGRHKAWERHMGRWKAPVHA